MKASITKLQLIARPEQFGTCSAAHTAGAIAVAELVQTASPLRGCQSAVQLADAVQQHGVHSLSKVLHTSKSAQDASQAMPAQDTPPLSGAADSFEPVLVPALASSALRMEEVGAELRCDNFQSLEGLPPAGMLVSLAMESLSPVCDTGVAQGRLEQPQTAGEDITSIHVNDIFEPQRSFTSATACAAAAAANMPGAADTATERSEAPGLTRTTLVHVAGVEPGTVVSAASSVPLPAALAGLGTALSEAACLQQVSASDLTLAATGFVNIQNIPCAPPGRGMVS